MNDVRRRLTIVGAGLAVPAVILATLAWAEWRAWAPVTGDGLRTVAEVVNGAHYTKAADRLRIAFATPDGRLIEASVPVWNLDAHHIGEGVVVAYDPANPRRVRTLDGWNPPYVFPSGMAALFALLAAGFLWRARRWPARLARAARGPSRPMLLAVASVPTGRINAPWGVLWDPAQAPPAPPVYAFRLADEADAPAGLIEVDVVGRVAERGVAVLRTGLGETISPAGKLAPPPRSVRRVLKGALPSCPAPVSTGPLAVPIALPRIEGGLPPLPDDFFAERRKPPSDRRTRTFAGAAAAAAVIAASLIVPDVVEAHRRSCATPPRRAAGAEPAATSGELARMLPGSLPGYHEVADRPMTLGSFPNPPTQLALADADFEFGYAREFIGGTTKAKVEVLQFSSEIGPARYEAQRLATLCTVNHHGLDTRAASGVSATITDEDDSAPVHRLTFIRGRRDYIVNLEGLAVTGDLEVLRLVMATAR